MPIYEYVCKSCQNKFELLRPFSKSQDGAECPRCHKEADRILSTCCSMSMSENGVAKDIGGGGSSCGSCGSHNCSSCGS